MRVRDLTGDEQSAIRDCLRFALQGGELEGEFQTRLGVTEAEVQALLEQWPEIDDASDESAAVVAINNALNEVCHGQQVGDWNRWFTVTPEALLALLGRWAADRRSPRPSLR